LQALLLQNAKCKMQRSESRAESSLSGYAERRMLSTKSNAKELGENPMQRTAGVGFLPAGPARSPSDECITAWYLHHQWPQGGGEVE
jgi:hypothetical protein